MSSTFTSPLPTGPYDPARTSWVDSANNFESNFPIQNLPFGIFSPHDGRCRPGIAIGDRIFDIEAGLDSGLFSGHAAEAAEAARGDRLNALLALPITYARALRQQVGALLDAASEESYSAKPRAWELLHDASTATLHLPVQVPNYTDFFAGIHHATAVGRLLHKDGEALPANYKWVPIAYHGRASSVRVSGGAVRRPNGQALRDGAVQYGRCEGLDIELEMGFFIGGGEGNPIGQPIPISEAEQKIFGFCLLNDWSARDIQGWEMYPLGPFLGKNFSTTISPWIITADALAPFRIPAMVRDSSDPQPLDYLSDSKDKALGGLDVDLEVRLQTAKMRELGQQPHTIIRSNARYLYWTVAQMVAHHSVGGCNLVPGDLIGTGTISGPERDKLSSLLELTFGGREPCLLPNGEERSFLADGDEITLLGRCNRPGFASIGFGECKGRIDPAPLRI